MNELPSVRLPVHSSVCWFARLSVIKLVQYFEYGRTDHQAPARDKVTVSVLLQRESDQKSALSHYTQSR